MKLDLSQKSITGKVYSDIIKNGLILLGEKVAVAVSGGADSICLLSILLELKDKLGIEILACHYNHRLRESESDADEKFVHDFCGERGVECIIGRAKVKNSLKSEESAREARYDFFEKVSAGEHVDRICLAHNLNDLAETVLFRLIRGSGFRGLKAIPRKREKFVRPLLNISRIEIEKYLADRYLEFRVDQTNADIVYSRNKIRHLVLPQIVKINPNIIETLGLSAEVFADDYDFLEKNARQALKKIILEKTSKEFILDRQKWLSLPSSMKRLTLRLAIDELAGLEDISLKQLEEVISVLDKGHGKKQKLLPHSLRISLDHGKIKAEKIIDRNK